MCPHISHNPGGRAREAREANPRCWQPVHPSRWAPASFDLRCDASVRQPERAPASFTLRCRPPTPLVVGSECSTTPPSQLWKVSEVSEWSEWSESNFWVFDPDETFICYRGCLNLSCYMGKKVHENFLMGLKIWWSWGSRFFFSKSP